LIGQGRDPMVKAASMPDPDPAAAAALRRAEAEGSPEAQALRGARCRRVAEAAGRYLRGEEQRRLDEIREVVLVSVNNVPVRGQDLVAGGPVNTAAGEVAGEGVVVGYQPRLGKVSLCHPKTDAAGREVRDKDGNRVWVDEEEKVLGIVLMRKYEQTLPALEK